MSSTPIIENGTFKGFAFSPHMRAAASLAGIAIWSQISLGFLMAWWTSGGALSGAIGWGLDGALEGWCAGTTQLVEAGSLIHLPARKEHAFRVASAAQRQGGPA